MKRVVAMVTASTLLVMLLSSIVPAQAASHDVAVAPAAGSTFHALSRMPEEVRSNLTLLTDDELASVAGAAGGAFGPGGLSVNLGIIVQVNVCAVCRGVRQSNFAISGAPSPSFGQGVPRFPGRP
jgi:uncharacterized membrane protein YfcA